MSRVVIADTSCLIALTNLNQLELLRRLFDSVTITSVVENEFGQRLPHWFRVENPRDAGQLQMLRKLVDPGEASEIALALENPGSLLIVDEKKGRRVAQMAGLTILGTLKILLEAKQRGWIPSLSECLQTLKQTDFRVAPALENDLLKLVGER